MTLSVMESNGNRVLHTKTVTKPAMLHKNKETSSERARLIEALTELHNLLEEYSPSWYTQEHHRKVESALHPNKKH